MAEHQFDVGAAASTSLVTSARSTTGGRGSGMSRGGGVIGGTLRRLGGARTEKVLFGKLEVQLPEALVEDVNIFMEIMSASTWKNVLTDSQRRHLLTLLPSFPQNEVLEKQETLRQVFGGQNFKFGNPLRQFHKKLRDGMFSPDIAKYAALCRRAKLKEYRYQQQVYYATLLKEVLVNRQRILEQVYQVAPDRPIKFEHFQWRPGAAQDKCLEQRVSMKVAEILKEVNEECGVGDSSTDDEDLSITALKPPSPASSAASQALLNDSPENSQQGCTVLSTLDTRPPPMPIEGGKPSGTMVKRSRVPRDFTEQDFKHMITRHKKRKREYPDHPELDIRSVTIEDVLTRCNLGKKTLKATQRKRVKAKAATSEVRKTSTPRSRQADPIAFGRETPDPPQPTFSQALGMSPIGGVPLPVPAHNGGPVSQYTVMVPPDEEMPDSSASIAAMEAVSSRPATDSRIQSVQEYTTTYDNFFSLLKAFICDESETRINTAKLEERVRDWQESGLAANNLWFTQQASWNELVPSALKFLSGDVLGLKLENFIPLVDYKERAQQWKWIAQGRDSDAELAVLYKYWRENSASNPAESGGGDRASSPPPPRQRTTFVVRPTTDEERNSFHDQEELRFTNPHKPYTFELHGYESVVGPVKGVFDKESNMNKAREHALLVSDRPAFVTILTLVRDAAARLPNGEGTRADICELLKDSQYLAPGVTDAQINTVVSGALDRLHYEKDPCVKYDVNRKLWIYLHRNRTEDDFERIHEADRAAAKAKKALGKSKPSKKAKEAAAAAAGNQATTSVVTTPAAVGITVATPTVPAATPVLTRQSSVLSTGSNDSFINVETLSPTPSGHSPRPSTPSSPRAGGSAGTSPRILQASPLVGQASKSQQAQGQIVAGAKLVAGMGGSPKTGAVSISQVLQGIQTTQPGQAGVGLSLVQSPQGSNVGSLTPGAKPLAFSLIQAQGRTKLVETTNPQHIGATKSDSPVGKSALAQTLAGSPTQPPLVVSSPRTPQTPPAANLRGPRPQAMGTSPVAAASPQAATGPRLTRLVQQLSLPQQAQLMAAVQGGGGGTQATTVRQKLMGAAMMGLQQSKTTQAGVVAALQGAQAAEVVPGIGEVKPETPTTPFIPTKPPIMLTKQVDKAPVAMAQTVATVTQPQPTATTASQLIQSATLSGKPGAFGGNPIIIGGKQALLSGKPLQIGGTSLQLIGKPGGQLGMVQGLPAGVTTVNVVTQSGAALTSTSLVTTQATGTKTITTPATAANATNPPLQILHTLPSTQTAAKVQQAGVKFTGGQIKVTGASSTVVTGSAAGARVLTQRPGGGLVVTQLPQGAAASKTGQAGGTGVHTKALTVSQANLLAAAAGQQIFVQQGGPGGQAKVMTTQQLLQGAGLRPTVLAASTAQGGKPGQAQNIQLVKTVLSQPGDKPGQTTILLTQPLTSGQSAVAVPAGSSTVQLTQASTAGGKIPTVATTATSKSKGGPVYARIITPPPGIRLAAVRPGQVTQVMTSGQMSPMPAGVSVIQALSRLPVDVQAQQAAQHQAGSNTASDATSSSDSDQK